MDTQQEINLQIYAAFEERGIEFAYPTQTLYVRGVEKEVPHPQIGFGREG